MTDGVKFGKYELLERLARGGMAEIFRALASSGPVEGEWVAKATVQAPVVQTNVYAAPQAQGYDAQIVQACSAASRYHFMAWAKS